MKKYADRPFGMLAVLLLLGLCLFSYISFCKYQFKQYYEEFKNTEDIQLDVDKQFFESVKSLLNTALLGHLGLELAEKISLTQNKKGQPFYLNVKPENIEIIDGHKFLQNATIEAIQEASKNFPKTNQSIEIQIPIEYKLI
jgi:hypothetical protein